MHIKITVRKKKSPHICQNGYYQKNESNKYWRGCRGTGTLVHCWWECVLMQSLWKTWRFLKKLKTNATWPSNSTTGYSSQENKTLIWKDRCIAVFTATLFIIVAKIWGQTKRPSMDISRWVEKEDMLYIFDGVLLGHNKNEILPFATTWIDLDGFTPNGNRTEKDNYHMIPLTCGI